MSENKFKSSAVKRNEKIAELANDESGFNEVKGTQRFSGQEALETINEAQHIPEEEKSVDDLRAERHAKLLLLEKDETPNPAMAMALQHALER